MALWLGQLTISRGRSMGTRRFGRGFVHLFAGQVLAKVAPFAVSTAAARRLSPEELGVPSIHFALATAAIQAPRDGLRRALLRVSKGAVVGAFLAPLAGAVIAALVACASRWAAGQEGDRRERYVAAMDMVSFFAFLELLGEPCYILSQRNGRYEARLMADGLSSALRSAVAYVSLIRNSFEPMMAFAMASAAYSIGGLLAYCAWWLSPGRRKALESDEGALACRFEGGFLSLCFSFGAQSLWKLLLSESERLAVASSRNGARQGVFGLVSGLCGAAARSILQPIEEAAFLSFSSRRQPVGAKARELESLLRLFMTAFLFCMAIGMPFSRAAIALLYGDRWARAEEAPATLAAHMAYLPLLAVNGVSEAYAHAAMDPSFVATANCWLAGFTGMQIALQLSLEPALGNVGIVLGSAVHMASRAAFNIVSASRAGQLPLRPRNCVPSPWLIVASLGVLLASLHVARTVLAAVRLACLLLIACLIAERKTVALLLRQKQL